MVWTGNCDPRCHGCKGPTNGECTGPNFVCVPNASDVGGNCVCDDEWTGPDCSYFKGACASTCHGCHGPLASHCEYCVEHAYKDLNNNDECTCDDLWNGPKCQFPYAVCNIVCKTCDRTDDVDDCLTCYDGYFKNASTKLCELCDVNCKTCTSGTGAYNECVTCHDGFFLESGECKACA